MLIPNTADNLLRYNDSVIRSQTHKLLHQSFKKEILLVISILQYLIFIYDESLITLIVRCFIQFLLYSVTPEKMGNNGSLNSSANESNGVINNNSSSNIDTTNSTGLSDVTQGTIGGAFGRINGISNTLMNSNTTAEETSNINERNLRLDFSTWSKEQKKFLLQNVLLMLITSWAAVIIYQIVFCLGYELSNLYFSFRGIFHASDDLNVIKEFSNGYLLSNLIGELKFRNETAKFATLIFFDFIVFSLEVLLVIINCIVGFGFIPEVDSSGTSDNEIEEFDGRQGRTVILRLNPMEALSSVQW